MFWRIWPVLCLLPALSAADLPITEVTLYKHGVAHLERAGELKPGETGRLAHRRAPAGLQRWRKALSPDQVRSMAFLPYVAGFAA